VLASFHPTKRLLVETAATQFYRYSKWIDVSIDFLTAYVAKARTQDELRNALRILTEQTQADVRKDARAERAQALAACFDNPRMAKQMGAERIHHEYRGEHVHGPAF